MTGWFRLLRDERGASAIEYCLLAVIVAIGLIAAVQLIGGKTSEPLVSAGDALVDGGGVGSN